MSLVAIKDYLKGTKTQLLPKFHTWYWVSLARCWQQGLQRWGGLCEKRLGAVPCQQSHHYVHQYQGHGTTGNTEESTEEHPRERRKKKEPETAWGTLGLEEDEVVEEALQGGADLHHSLWIALSGAELSWRHRRLWRTHDRAEEKSEKRGEAGRNHSPLPGPPAVLRGRRAACSKAWREKSGAGLSLGKGAVKVISSCVFSFISQTVPVLPCTVTVKQSPCLCLDSLAVPFLLFHTEGGQSEQVSSWGGPWLPSKAHPLQYTTSSIVSCARF